MAGLPVVSSKLSRRIVPSWTADTIRFGENHVSSSVIKNNHKPTRHLVLGRVRGCHRRVQRGKRANSPIHPPNTARADSYPAGRGPGRYKAGRHSLCWCDDLWPRGECGHTGRRGGASQYEWSSFAGKLAEAGYTVLSIASLDQEFTSVDYERYAIEFLRAHAFKKIVCIGDSMGASGCAFNAHEPELRGLVLLTYHGSADLTDITYPKIFIASGKGGYQNTTTTGYQAAADPKTLVIIPNSTDVSPSLVDSPGVDLHKQILDMLKDVFGQ
jgi:hypothetical protein